MTPSPNQTLYGRFLKNAQSAQALPAGVALHPLESLLLQEVFLRNMDKKPLTVTEAIALNHLASPSTLHKRIMRLKALDLLAMEHPDQDHRTKYLVLTPDAMAHFEALGQAMREAVCTDGQRA
jgi:hypothetical protein